MTDGTRHAAGEVHARGGPERPFAPSDMCYGGTAPPQGRLAAIRDTVPDLPRGRPMADLSVTIIDPV